VLGDAGFPGTDFKKRQEKDYSYLIAVRMIEHLQHKAVHDATWKKTDQGLAVGEFSSGIRMRSVTSPGVMLWEDRT